MGKHDGLLLRDPDQTPDDDVLAEAFEGLYPVYVRFAAEVSALGIEQRWQFYRDGGAWLAKGVNTVIGSRGGRKEIPMYWLSVWEDSLRVTVYFKSTDRVLALDAPVSDETIDQIANAAQMGKINQFPVEFILGDDTRLLDLIALIKHKRDTVRN